MWHEASHARQTKNHITRALPILGVQETDRWSHPIDHTSSCATRGKISDASEPEAVGHWSWLLPDQYARLRAADDLPAMFQHCAREQLIVLRIGAVRRFQRIGFAASAQAPKLGRAQAPVSAGAQQSGRTLGAPIGRRRARRNLQIGHKVLVHFELGACLRRSTQVPYSHDALVVATCEERRVHRGVATRGTERDERAGSCALVRGREAPSLPAVRI